MFLLFTPIFLVGCASAQPDKEIIGAKDEKPVLMKEKAVNHPYKAVDKKPSLTFDFNGTTYSYIPESFSEENKDVSVMYRNSGNDVFSMNSLKNTKIIYGLEGINFNNSSDKVNRLVIRDEDSSESYYTVEYESVIESDVKKVGSKDDIFDVLENGSEEKSAVLVFEDNGQLKALYSTEEGV